MEWRGHSLLELAIGRVVGENRLSRVELMCCINDWRGKRRGRGERRGRGGERIKGEKYMQESKR